MFIEEAVKTFFCRYTASKFDTVTRKARVSEDWVVETLAPYCPDPGSVLANIHSKEDQKMNKSMASVPMPTTVGAFKNHPLYALQVRPLTQYFLFILPWQEVNKLPSKINKLPTVPVQ